MQKELWLSYLDTLLVTGCCLLHQTLYKCCVYLMTGREVCPSPVSVLGTVVGSLSMNRL